MKRVSEAQMVHNYRNPLLSKTNGTETTRRFHLRRVKRKYGFGMESCNYVTICNMHELGHHALTWLTLFWNALLRHEKRVAGDKRRACPPLAHSWMSFWHFMFEYFSIVLKLNECVCFCAYYCSKRKPRGKLQTKKIEKQEEVVKLVLISYALMLPSYSKW